MTLCTSQKTGWAPGYALKERSLLTRFSHPWYVRGFGSRIPQDAKICRCSGPLYKMAWYLHITYAHPPIYLKSSLDYLQYLVQCKCCVTSCQCTANSTFAFFELTGIFFFPNIFNLQLVESTDTEPEATEGRLYSCKLFTRVSLTGQGTEEIYCCRPELVYPMLHIFLKLHVFHV